MILCFQLSMPGCSSWNGRWSGEGRFYAITRSFRGKKSEANAEAILKKGYFSYHFGDGWVAGITVTSIEPKSARGIRKRSQGFYGYDWMVDSIILNGKIQASELRP